MDKMKEIKKHKVAIYDIVRTMMNYILSPHKHGAIITFDEYSNYRIKKVFELVEEERILGSVYELLDDGKKHKFFGIPTHPSLAHQLKKIRLKFCEMLQEEIY